MSVNVKMSDTRTAEIPVPCDSEDTETLGTWLKQAGEEGYSITGVTELQSGHQRDPYTTGLRITVKRGT